MDCGAEKVVVFADTTSKDGRFALAWTLRPNLKKDPVDWSTYTRDPDGSFSFLTRYATEDNEGDMEKGDYLAVDGVLDWTTKKFMPLPTTVPYFPGKNRGHLSVTWSKSQRGFRFAVVANDTRFSTADLWLVVIDARGQRARNLITAADQAVQAYMRKRDPKDYRRYETSYDADDPRTIFGAASLKIHFDTGIPKDDVNYDDGNITFALPQGIVTSIAKK